MKRFNTSGAARKADRRYKFMPVFLLVLPSLMFTTVTPAANLVVNGDFEEPKLTLLDQKNSRAKDKGWTTFFGQNFSGTCTEQCNPDANGDTTLIPGWSVLWTNTVGIPDPANPGQFLDPVPGRIEIQGTKLVDIWPGATPAKDGDQKAELDSHDRVTGSIWDNNVTLFQEVEVCANTAYVLTYNWKSRRPIVGDNNVHVMVDGHTRRTHAMNTSWAQETVRFVTNDTGKAHISFVSIGTANTYGMYLDDVSLEGPLTTECPDPCPDCSTDLTAVGCVCQAYVEPDSGQASLMSFTGSAGWSVIKRGGAGDTPLDPPKCFCLVKSQITWMELLYDGDNDSSYRGITKSTVAPESVSGGFPAQASIKVFSKGSEIANSLLTKGQTVTFSIPDKEIIIEIWDRTGTTKLQTVTLHTSCSDPLERLDSFGGVTIWSMTK